MYELLMQFFFLFFLPLKNPKLVPIQSLQDQMYSTVFRFYNKTFTKVQTFTPLLIHVVYAAFALSVLIISAERSSVQLANLTVA